jgi:hypothetical protein
VRLVPSNPEPIPEDLGSLLRAYSVSGKLLLIELKGKARGVEGMPLDHVLKTATGAGREPITRGDRYILKIVLAYPASDELASSTAVLRFIHSALANTRRR